MTVDDVKKRVEEIRASADDPERAHQLEDSLWLDTLEAIADGAANHQGLALEAALTSGISFDRWRG
jgi:hypothetical protein